MKTPTLIRRLYTGLSTGLAVTMAMSACYALSAVMIAFMVRTTMIYGIDIHHWSPEYVDSVSNGTGLVAGFFVVVTIFGCFGGQFFERPERRRG